MADVELFKLIMNGGSFALMALFVVWILFKASPILKESLEKKDAAHNATILAMAADHRTTMTAMAEAHRTSIATLAAEFRASLAEMHRECRDERADLLKRADDEREKDRQARMGTRSTT